MSILISTTIPCHIGLMPKGSPHIGLFKNFVDLPTYGPFYKLQFLDKLTKQQQLPNKITNTNYFMLYYEQTLHDLVPVFV